MRPTCSQLQQSTALKPTKSATANVEFVYFLRGECFLGKGCAALIFWFILYQDKRTGIDVNQEIQKFGYALIKRVNQYGVQKHGIFENTNLYL